MGGTQREVSWGWGLGVDTLVGKLYILEVYTMGYGCHIWMEKYIARLHYAMTQLFAHAYIPDWYAYLNMYPSFRNSTVDVRHRL